MAGTNGHAPAGQVDTTPTADKAELDALLAGLFEPVQFEIAPGRMLEIRPLRLAQADGLYGRGLSGEEQARFMIGRCVFLPNGHRLGADLAGDLPLAVWMRLAAEVMKVNAMTSSTPAESDEAAGETDPKV